jgi:hypothetical protein
MKTVNDFYKGNQEIKKKGVEIEYTPEQVDELIKCYRDINYFLEKYVYIISLDEGKVLFKTYDFQKDMLRQFKNNRFTIATLGRQLGKCLCKDTYIHTRNKTTGEVFNIEIEKFCQLASLNRINTDSLILDKKFTDSMYLDNWEISTDTGWKRLKAVHKTIPYSVWRIETESGLWLEGADHHIVILDNHKQCFIENLIPNKSKIITKNGVELVTVVQDLFREEEMFDAEVDSEDHLYWTNNILSHNTITVCAYLLYEAIFNNDYFIAILANNAAKSREILSRLKLMYELLPFWLKPGVVEWNKGSVEFSNGSKIFAGPTTNSSIRGFSINCVVGETEIVIKNDDGEIENITIQELFENDKYNINKFDLREKKENVMPRPIKENKYQKIYDRLIKKALLEERSKNKGYYESHHIIPHSLGGSNKKENLVLLTLREHFVAHKLLVKMYEGEKRAKMAVALFMMSNTRGIRISSRLYEEGRQSFLQNIQKREWTDEEKSQMSSLKKEYWEENKNLIMKKRYESDHYQKVSNALKLHQRTEEHINKINKNPEKIRKTAEKHRGMKRTDETRQRQSESKKKFIQENGTKSFGKGMMYVHHKDTKKVKRVEKDFDLGTEWIKGSGIKRSEETRRKISINNGMRKKI